MIKKSAFFNNSKFLQQRHSPIILGLFALLVIIFLYIRIDSIAQQTVPYTYDQGRDFLAARDIIIEKDVTLIGPTTGAGGVFHGAWWYYFLAIPFALTGGSPTAFYYFITLVAVAQALLFSYFLYKKTHPSLAILFMSIVTISPYFIRTSIFAINSTMTLPFLLLLMYSLYFYLDSKKLPYLFLMSLSIGMVFESEVAFGMFLIPAAILTMIVTKQARLYFGSPQKVLSVIGGFIVATSLRIIFELKYGFMQTKALWAFKDSGGTNPVSLSKAFTERVMLFIAYFREIFPETLEFLGWVVLGLSIIGLAKGYKLFNQTEKHFTKLLAVLLVFLLFAASLYHKNFFWTYYFEGIQFLFLGLLMFGLFGLLKGFPKHGVYFIGGLVTILITMGMYLSFQKIALPEKTQNEGLLMHTKAIDYIHSQVGSKSFCLRKYTPPVLTYTYDYLLDYHSRTKGMTYPHTEYKHNECWYVIESDTNSERREDWLQKNIPEKAKQTLDYVISKDLRIQRWQYPAQ